jgi:uncharacterized repeat protein (TIGR03803 family)
MKIARSAQRSRLQIVVVCCATLVLSGCGGGGSNSSATLQKYTVGGFVQGLSGPGLVLTNGSDTLKVPENATSFTMPTTLANGNGYDVTVQVNPTALSCTVISGAGTVNDANVTSVTVSCAAGTESVVYSFTGGARDGAKSVGSLLQGSDGNFYGMATYGGTNNSGVVFKITPDGTETVLYSFQGGAKDGEFPSGDLIQASDGNFYGMTPSGGANGVGVVFKITPAGAETVLYSFQGGTTDGAWPSGDLVQGSDGNFYGMTSQGGPYGSGIQNGVVFKITPGGTETILHAFQNTPTDGAHPSGSLIQGSDGNFYGMTPDGGANNSGIVFRITPSGTETILYSFNSVLNDGISPNGSLIQGSDGNFYGTTSLGGGPNENGVVFKITPAGTETVLYSFPGQVPESGNPEGSLIQGSDGNFYGMTYYGGVNNDGVVFKITPAGTETVLYSFQGGTTDGMNPQGSLVQGTNGDLYGMTVLGGAGNFGTIFKLN